MKKIILLLSLFFVPCAFASAAIVDRAADEGYEYLMVAADNTGEEHLATVRSKFLEPGIYDDFLDSIDIIDVKEYDVWQHTHSWKNGDGMFFYPEMPGGHNIILSGDYFAITAENESPSKPLIIAFRMEDDKLDMIYQRNVWDLSHLGYFGLYNNILVYQGADGDPNTLSSKRKISYVDLAGNTNEVTTINADDGKSYLSPAIYERSIAYVTDSTIYIYDLDTGQSREIAPITGSFNGRLNFYGDNIVYESFYNERKNLIIVDANTSEAKKFFDYEENDNADFLTMNGNYIGFAMRASASYGRKKIYVYDIDHDYLYVMKADNYNFGFSALTGKMLVWTDDQSGDFRYYYAYIDRLAMDSEYIYRNNLFPITEAAYEKLGGKILLQVEQNGEAWFVDPLPNKKKPFYIDELAYENLPRENMRFLGRPRDAFNIMRAYGIGARNDYLNTIPIGLSDVQGVDKDGDGLTDTFEDAIGTDDNKRDTDGDGYDDKDEVLSGFNPAGEGKMPILPRNPESKGGIYLQTENHGEAWYVNPADGKRYFLGRPADAFNIMKSFGLGISNDDFLSLFP